MPSLCLCDIQSNTGESVASRAPWQRKMPLGKVRTFFNALRVHNEVVSFDDSTNDSAKVPRVHVPRASPPCQFPCSFK